MTLGLHHGVVGGLGVIIHWQLLTRATSTSPIHPSGVTRREGKRARLSARH